MIMRIQILKAILVICFITLTISFINADVATDLTKIKRLVENGEYEYAISELKAIELECAKDTIIEERIDFNLCMGAALYFTNEYKKAIPYLQSALQQMSYKPDDGDCNYLETLYGVASCYYHIKDYKNAESYYRKAIITNDIQNFACSIITQIYTELIELYTETNQPTLADLCTKYLEIHQLGLSSRAKNYNYNDWHKIVVEIYTGLPSPEIIKPEEKQIIVEKLSSIQEIINSNAGKNNDEYIYYTSIYAKYMLYTFNDTIAAKELNLELINIGHELTEYKPEIASAYEDYLSLISAQNEIDLVNSILPEAIKYYKATPNKNRDEVNLYEVVGVGLCNVGNFNDGLSYLEKVINSGDQLGIAALVHLSDYYNRRDPQKGLSFFYRIEKLFNQFEAVAFEKKHILYNEIMSLNTQLGNYQEAMAYGNKLISLKNEFNFEDNTLAFVLTNCAVLSGKTNNLTNAEKLFSSIDSIYNNISEDYKTYYLSNKGYTYLICGEYDKAIASLELSIQIALHNQSKENLQIGIIYHNLGRAYMLIQNYEVALKYLYISKDIQTSINGRVIENTTKYIKECEAKK